MARITTTLDIGEGVNPFTTNTTKPKWFKVRAFRAMLKKLEGGLINSRTVSRPTLKVGTASATGTITLVAPVAGTVIDINGVEFIGVSTDVDLNLNEFDVSGTDTAKATSLAACINACTSVGITGVLTATSSLGVVTLIPAAMGLGPNAITVKTLGIVAFGSVTMASVANADTFSINATAMTATQHNATGTVTCVSAIAGNKVTISGVEFVGTAGAVVLGTKTFSIDTSDTATATSLAAQVNGYFPFAGVITATSSVGVATLRYETAGTAGNAITFISSDGGTLAVTGSGFLSAGAAVGNNAFDFTGTNTQTATALVAAINASSTALVSAHAKAYGDATIVRVRAKYGGVKGNAITIASSNGTRLAITSSAARLAGATTLSFTGAQATGTVTLASGSGNYTVTINGVNATGTIAWASSDTVTAALIAAAISSSADALVAGVVTASSSAGVVTITSVAGGVAGNAITLACTGTNATASVARLATGAVPTFVVPSGDRLTGGTSSTLTF